VQYGVLHRNAWDLNPWDDRLQRCRIMDSIPSFPVRPMFFFGGFGEPLSHPAIVDMVTQARQAGTRVELITNGTLLTEELARKLIAARLDVLWVSLDGATPESYADVRLGAALPEVLANIARLRDIRPPSPNPKPAIGIEIRSRQTQYCPTACRFEVG
jgi:MoaA/NifB/PqqE/SkfB family radical SAM enzyme